MDARRIAIRGHRATQRDAIDDYRDAHRVMRRVAVAGERAVSVDGQRSRARDAVH